MKKFDSVTIFKTNLYGYISLLNYKNLDCCFFSW